MSRQISKLKQLSKWNYRLHCLYDYYIRPDYSKKWTERRISEFGDKFYYTGYWDKITRSTRSPYVYRSYIKIEKVIESWQKSQQKIKYY